MALLPPAQAPGALFSAAATFTSLVLPDGAVHIWSAPLDLPSELMPHFESLLSPGEIARADRFVFEKTRRHFIAGRGLLRSILSWYAGRQAGELEFEYGPYGKPALAESCEGAWLRFNVSHSRDRALYALARGREVGVDVEYMRTDLEYEGIAKRFFSPRESAVLRALPKSQRCEAFFNCWTRKE
ncbi:MAG: 4'-phosphopantetheinyl transferase superfamily protein, partial [Chloroflexota bacterium]|nr:4'-phosphopantetheinyl transferase superfamily protein [Chloroflexota bacterium]